MGLDPLPPIPRGTTVLQFLGWIWGLFQNFNDSTRPGLGDRLQQLAGQADRL